MTAIWWVRRDLRLHDNPALAQALTHGNVVPIFVLDSVLLEGRYHRGADRRKAFLFAGLAALDIALRERGSRLVIRSGNPAIELPKLAGESGAEAIYAGRDYSPYARRRDQTVASQVALHLTDGTAIRPPEAVLKDDGDPFKVFTPYSRAWLREPPHRVDLLGPSKRLAPVPDAVESVPLPLRPEPVEGRGSLASFPAGETEALRRLEAFAGRADGPIAGYADGRNRLDLESTSTLSPYLRFGMLSPRLAAVTALEVAARTTVTESQKGAQSWLNELIWRDFYLSVLHHNPEVLRREFDPAFRGMRWRNDPDDIEAWQAGKTGYPVIDAAMRQLLETGWMHNRARMIVASFLVKHLLADWRVGEAWFMRHLVDGDPAANNGGWQWAAGVGTDAAPYFRVFNPVLQAKRFDPDGAFARRWLPELSNVQDRFIHEPWKAPDSQRPKDYPAPIVDLSEGRQRALEAYKAARESAER